MAGLAAAKPLTQAGKSVTILEASDRIGGRVKTDLVDGYRLDHGFQVLLTAYPEAQEQLDYDALNLCSFKPGAVVLHEKGKSLIADPFREPVKALGTLFAPVGKFSDKLKLLRLRRDLKEVPVSHIFRMPSLGTWEMLRSKEFSDSMRYKFFLPFLSGIYLDPQLKTSSRMFDFVYKMFSEGDAAVPRLGMEEIPKQLASKLDNAQIRTQTRVSKVEGNTVTTESGEQLTAKRVLLACEPGDWLRQYNTEIPGEWHSTTCLYFAADSAPEKDPYLVLNGTRKGIVNNVMNMSAASGDYAPAGKQLISVSLVGQQAGTEEELVQKARTELAQWYKKQPQGWQFLRSYTIDQALPKIQSLYDTLPANEFKLNDVLFATGDYLLNGSINGALKAGRLAGEALVEDLA